MTTLLVIVWILLAVSLLVVTAMRPTRSRHSRFELERRGDKDELRRERLFGGVQALLWLKAGLLIVFITVVSVALWQGWGVIDAILLILAVVLLAHTSSVGRLAMRLYESEEPWLLKLVERSSQLKWLAHRWQGVGSDQKIESPEHLLHLIESAGHVLDDKQVRLLKRSLGWHAVTVTKVMTPVAKIVSITQRELLGPLVLNDLHQSGHQRFPVTRGGIDHVVGQVDIEDMLEVDAAKKSQTAEKVMTPLEVRLAPETTLPDALDQLLDRPGQLGIVVDDDGKTIGLVTLRDVLGALLG